MLYAKYVLFSTLLLLSCGLAAQPDSELKEEAKAYIATEHYEDAIRTLERSRQLVRNDEESQFLIAVCHYQLNRLTEAKQLLENLTTAEKSPYPECWLYLGKILHAQQQFVEAAALYKLYLRTLRPDAPNRRMTIEEIRRCDNGIRLQYHEPHAVVENMGPQVNTTGDEFGPVLSPTRSSQLYFTSIRRGNSGGPRNKNTRPDEKFGNFLSDMYRTQQQGGQWQKAEPMHNLLNSPQHEYLIGFAGQGKVMLYYQGWNWERGQIFADTFQQNTQRTLTTTPFLAPVRGQNGEQQLFVHNDTLILFASRRAGGYGGLDLYQTVFRNGRWQTAENLGPTINSAFDESTPFLARDGQTLYFSTNDSRKSIGGLDVMRTVYLPEARRWSDPENMGIPINSAADDSHFRLARDGFTGFFSSARKDGFGDRDLYVAYFTKYRQEMEPPIAMGVNTPPIPATTNPVNLPTATPSRPSVSPPPTGVTNSVPTVWQTDFTAFRTAPTPEWLSDLAEGARTYSQDHLVLTCYVPQNSPSSTSSELYSGLQLLESYSRLLQEQGISAERIFLRTLTHSAGTYRVNAHLAPRAAEMVVRPFPVIGSELTKGNNATPLDRALCYKVQVMAVQRSVNDAKLSQQPQLMLEHSGDQPYLRYTAGAFDNFAQADDFRRELLAIGYRGAYVVPYLRGVRLDKNNAMRYVSLHPDLENFLDR